MQNSNNEKESRRKIIIEYNPSILIKKDGQRCFNGGYLFLQKAYLELGLDKICKKIEKKHKNKYDLNEILSMLLYARVLYPGSKLLSLEDARRWILEDCFRITKTEFEARPVFLQRDDRIKAHFLTCFLALLLYKYLEKKVNRGGKRFSPAEIIDTLQDMNFLAVSGEGYVPTYTRTDVTNNLHGSAGFRTDTQIVSKQRMKAIIAESKKSTKKD